MNFPAQMVHWVQNFTSHRTTQLQTHQSSPSPDLAVSMGIPQGSPASPLLYLIYSTPILKLLETIPSLKYICFMDDICLYADTGSYTFNNRIIRSSFSMLKNEAAKYDIKFDDAEKFKFIHFHPSQAVNIFPLNNETTVEKTVKYLGIKLDYRLNFKEEIDARIGKLKSLTMMMRKLCTKVNVRSEGARTEAAQDRNEDVPNDTGRSSVDTLEDDTERTGLLTLQCESGTQGLVASCESQVQHKHQQPHPTNF
ncbi:unnamed protein product [Ambrosiozyma monospora]|uniref:Unnamed protein product n=1 Tax=Ambrosiozyma monospora TaxID=43982 RepID=A0A9W7DI85_AMBMO|nr:unnamed protein product [Ambrosiozyma monospora]